MTPSVRPQISGEIKNMEEYDRIILGYPIWHSQAPKIIITFLEKYDFSKKIQLSLSVLHIVVGLVQAQVIYMNILLLQLHGLKENVLVEKLQKKK